MLFTVTAAHQKAVDSIPNGTDIHFTFFGRFNPIAVFINLIAIFLYAEFLSKCLCDDTLTMSQLHPVVAIVHTRHRLRILVELWERVEVSEKFTSDDLSADVRVEDTLEVYVALHGP